MGQSTQKLPDELLMMRKAVDKSPEQMAKIANVSHQTYRNWENGDTEPKLSQYRKLHSYCNSKPSDLLFSSKTVDFFMDMINILPKKSRQAIKDKIDS
ncbi:helix-turn-helix domain-containing protein [Pseudoalteromonas sp. C2R02]|uniref:helix-turn-helix transcriptional regulator n=1 Tax=Pseudoalteromonas sp. C2R02 TaxID=2841565 RepID=UPI001C09E590|nr:helix-turn-helix transcriptional regulator [Pseudoalteromonas sp. C2R02]MBU2968750.1 helix-turn-helix domain-containing protein [Pseudoalteromonas sp. C2R02]